MGREIDEVHIRILADGNVGFGNLLGEAGFAALVEIYYNDKSSKLLLFDTGSSTPALMHNVKQLELNLSLVDMVVLSHGHWDHMNGLREVLDEIRKNTPILFHPNAIAPKIFTTEDGNEHDQRVHLQTVG